MCSMFWMSELFIAWYTVFQEKSLTLSIENFLINDKLCFLTDFDSVHGEKIRPGLIKIYAFNNG